MGEYRFSSLLKQNKKTKICFVIYIAGFFFLKFFCYEVIVKQKIYKVSSKYYSHTHTAGAFLFWYGLGFGVDLFGWELRPF